MSKLHKSILFVLFIALAFATLLSPALLPSNDMASVEQPQAAQSVALVFTSISDIDDGWMPFGYTWAG